MGKISQFRMVKLMQTKKAYTTLEMLLVLSLILVMILFSIPRKINNLVSNENIIDKIACLIDSCRFYSIEHKQSATIRFIKNQVITPNEVYEIEKGRFLQNISFTYLKNGHIQRGGHVTYCHGKCYNFIFNVGNGAVRIEEKEGIYLD